MHSSNQRDSNNRGIRDLKKIKVAHCHPHSICEMSLVFFNEIIVACVWLVAPLGDTGYITVLEKRNKIKGARSHPRWIYE